jgi:hypothetical protein
MPISIFVFVIINPYIMTSTFRKNPKDASAHKGSILVLNTAHGHPSHAQFPSGEA